jgi:hypothetical protein
MAVLAMLARLGWLAVPEATRARGLLPAAGAVLGARVRSLPKAGCLASQRLRSARCVAASVSRRPARLPEGSLYDSGVVRRFLNEVYDPSCATADECTAIATQHAGEPYTVSAPC